MILLCLFAAHFLSGSPAFAEQEASPSEACKWLLSEVSEDPPLIIPDIDKLITSVGKLTPHDLYAIGNTYYSLFDQVVVRLDRIAHFDELAKVANQIPELSKRWEEADYNRAVHVMMTKVSIPPAEVASRLAELTQLATMYNDFLRGIKRYIRIVQLNAKDETSIKRDQETISAAQSIEEGVVNRKFLMERLKLRIELLTILPSELEFLQKFAQNKHSINSSIPKQKLYNFWRLLYYFNRPPNSRIDSSVEDPLYDAYNHSNSFLKNLLQDAHQVDWNSPSAPQQKYMKLPERDDDDSTPSNDGSDLPSAADITN